MTDYSELSDREIDTLVRDRLDSANLCYVYNTVHNRLEPLCYTSSFDEALRVLRGMGYADCCNTYLACWHISQTHLQALAWWLIMTATPRQLCEAMLRTTEVGDD